MNNARLFQSKVLLTLLLVACGFLQGCSESSTPAESPVITELAEDANTNSVEESPFTDTDSVGDINTDTNIDSSTNTLSNDVIDDAPDPMVHNRTDVSFEITVPAYQSNALQVQLSWGDFNTSLNWIGDEFWSVDANLPSDIEHLLSIVFYDDNGNLELGSYEQTYRSGTNAAEIYQVSADQFDTGQWDEDGDGTSNLDELIAGTAPDVDEDSLLDISDVRNMGLLFIANYFETIIDNERPNQFSRIEESGERYGRSARADIDAGGNGTASANSWSGIEQENRSAVRTVLDNKVSWEGSWNFYDGDYSLSQDFTSDITVDGESRALVEAGTGSWVGTYSDRWETSVNLTGKPIEGSDYCAAESGTITQTHRSNRYGGTVQTLTITRESDDDLWRVMSTFESSADTNTNEYFARELIMHMIVLGYQKQVSEHDYFFCNFADL